jgi:hypothetical protein
MSRHIPIPRRNAAPAYVQTLQRAIEAHQAGRLDDAEALLYRRVLEMRAGQPDALHYLGVLHHQRGQSDDPKHDISIWLKPDISI